MMDQANCFYQAGSRCEADIRLSPLITNSLTAPAVVCYAFALEIYLKLLSRIGGAEPGRSHILLDLFNGLPEAVKQVIARHHQMHP